MSDKNSFRDSLRVDSETMAKLDSVSKNYSTKKSSNSKAENSGGRERGKGIFNFDFIFPLNIHGANL